MKITTLALWTLAAALNVSLLTACGKSQEEKREEKQKQENRETLERIEAKYVPKEVALFGKTFTLPSQDLTPGCSFLFGGPYNISDKTGSCVKVEATSATGVTTFKSADGKTSHTIKHGDLDQISLNNQEYRCAQQSLGVYNDKSGNSVLVDWFVITKKSVTAPGSLTDDNVILIGSKGDRCMTN